MKTSLASSASLAPQPQTSNYPTVHNISFRSSLLSTPLTKRNTKLKCPSCGVWGEKGTVCNVCRSAIPGPRPIYAPLSSETARRPTTDSAGPSAVLRTGTQACMAASNGTAKNRGSRTKHEAQQATAESLHQCASRSRPSAPFADRDTADILHPVLRVSRRAHEQPRRLKNLRIVGHEW
ncbi:hypothetical protein LSCM1_03966 [Leishmania martiniquensis]|uniref:Uncharacterized protein n=1 Tax=Leishmania martiniquensis TaxID=1580590 RepID=A0A836GRC9_9TRYP|nr:hypothetical protein LSCM1_03966 [Leishmania martiniquensis]